MMMTATERYEKAWSAFLTRLNSKPETRLRPFLADKHVSYGGMQNWMMTKGYSVLRAKEEARRKYAEALQQTLATTCEQEGSLFVSLEIPAQEAPTEDVLSGISLTFPNGTIVNIKKGSAKSVMALMKLYEKEDMLCLD